MPGSVAPRGPRRTAGSQTVETRITTCVSVICSTRTTRPPTWVCPPTGTITVCPATSTCAMSASTRTSRAVTPSTDTSVAPERGNVTVHPSTPHEVLPPPPHPVSAPTATAIASSGARRARGAVTPTEHRRRGSRRPRVGMGPGVLGAALEAQRLLLHHRRRLSRTGAALVAVPQRVPDLVVHDVLPVAGEVVGVLVGAVDPAVEGEHGAGAVAARQRAVGAGCSAEPGAGAGAREHDRDRGVPVR